MVYIWIFEVNIWYDFRLENSIVSQGRIETYNIHDNVWYSTNRSKNVNNILCFSFMNNHIIWQEKVSSHQQMLIFIFECLSCISACISYSNIFISNPNLLRFIINKRKIFWFGEDIPSVILSFYLVIADEIVVVSVLILV